MLVNDLIKKLSCFNREAPLMAYMDKLFDTPWYVDTFENNEGWPTIHLIDSPPLPSVKKCSILIEELKSWAKGNYSKNQIYLIYNFVYEDESYDIRYFELKDAIQEESYILLVATSEESVELRESFEAFDESMYDTDD